MSKLNHVLDRVSAVAQDGRLPVVVFDLDSTLFNTSGRHLAILRAFAQTEPSIRPVVDQITPEDFSWSVAGPLRRAGVDDPGLLESLSRFWYDRFFHDEWLQHDGIARGAPEYVHAVWKAGALVYYLTGRHVGGMEKGTTAALVSAGFPVYSGRAVVHLKPDFNLPDTPFKDQAIRDIESLRGEVVATFENEPGNANLFLRRFPGAEHFLVGTVCSPEAEDPHPELIRIDDFVPRDP